MVENLQAIQNTNQTDKVKVNLYKRRGTILANKLRSLSQDKAVDMLRTFTTVYESTEAPGQEPNHGL